MNRLQLVQVEPMSARDNASTAVYLSEVLDDINQGAGFLDRLSLDEANMLRRAASHIEVEAGESIFMQGDVHNGIFLIEQGRVRVFYAGPAGREITLAYWSPGHFIGGPEVFGGGVHMWSAVATQKAVLAYLSAPRLRQLATQVPAVALALIDGLVSKGKCYSALVQMLGTRSVTERLAQLLVILASVEGKDNGSRLVVDRRITHDQLAAIVGSTRQWVTTTLSRFQDRGIVQIQRGQIVILEPDKLPLQT